MQLVCRDRNRLALQADIVGAALHGIENICCLTGDDVTAGDEPEARRVFDLDAPAADRAGARDRARAATSRAARSSPAPQLFIGAVENPGAPPLELPRRARAARRRAPARASSSCRSASSPSGSRRSWPRPSRSGSTERAALLPVDHASCARRARCASSTTKVPGISVPAATIERVETRRRPAARRASSSPASSPRTRSSLPGVARPAPDRVPQGRGHRRALPAARHSDRDEERRRRVETVLQSRSRTVVIGRDQPFCVIGERINPTGRKAFAGAAQAATSRSSRSTSPRRSQAAPTCSTSTSAIPLVDEAELLRAGGPHRAGPDRPAALHRLLGDRGARGRAWPPTRARRSSTPSPARTSASRRSCRSSRKHGAAVIGLANDETASRWSREQRLEIARKIVSAAGDYGIPPEDVVIDPLAMTVGALPTRSRSRSRRSR